MRRENSWPRSVGDGVRRACGHGCKERERLCEPSRRQAVEVHGGQTPHQLRQQGRKPAVTPRQRFEVAEATLMPRADSWYVGANIPGKKRVYMPYFGGFDRYSALCEEIAADGYRGFKLFHHGDGGQTHEAASPPQARSV